MRDWRERDGRPEPRPASVLAVVRGTRSALCAAHAAEACLLFLAAALAVRAAAVLSDAARPESWTLALIAGALAGACWWREHVVDPEETAERLDRGLRHHGALVTAFELEARGGERSALEVLVSERVLERLRSREALRALAPPLLAPLAAPVLAGLGLVLVVDAVRAPAGDPTEATRLVQGLEAALGAAAAEMPHEAMEGLASSEASAALGEFAARRELLEHALETGGGARAEAGQAIEDLDRGLSDLVALLPEGAAASSRKRLEEARAWLDALRMALVQAEPVPPNGEPAGAGLEAGRGTGAGPEGTISGSSTSPRGPPIDPFTSGAHPIPARPATSEPGPAPDAPAGTPGTGTANASWWPPEYDGVVERWIELRRAALADE